MEVGENNGKAWVRVADNGPGIDPEHLPHLFERFFRVDQARSHNPEAASEALDNNLTPGEIPGSGLGLSIVQWIMTMHHGQVSVQSEVGKGSTFELHLPGGNSSIHTTSAEHSLDHLYS